MVQRSYRAGLAVESRGELIAYDLDRYGTIEATVSGSVDVAHPAGTAGEDLVRPQLGSNERMWHALR
jgi:hypothetical protein